MPEINALEPEVERLTDEQLRARTDEFREQVDQARAVGQEPRARRGAGRRPAARPPARRVRDRARGRAPGARPAPLRRAAHGRRRAAPRLGRRDEDRRGQDARRDAAVVPQRARRAGACTSSRSTTTSRAATPTGWASCTASSGSPSARSSPTTRRPRRSARMYDCDITYGTNNEFGFDYLRDNMVTSIEDQVQRGDAPPVAVAALLRDRRRGRLDPHRRGAHAAHHLRPRDRRRRALLPVRPHRARAAARARLRGRRGQAHRRAHRGGHRARRGGARCREPLRARQPELRAPDPAGAEAPRSSSSATSTTSCSNGEVHIVDEFTGRILEGRRWSEGLHQAVEAKEGVHIKEENQTLATVTLQNYFRMYNKLSGMTGTANTEAGEFAHTYDLQVVSIPTQPADGPHRQRRLHLQDRRREVRRGHRRHRRAAREGPAGAGRHDLGREVGEAVAAAREAGHPARGAEREAARPGSRDRHPGGPALGGHRGHQHGRPRRRHPARRQPRGSGRAASACARASRSVRPSTRPATPSCCPGSRTSARSRATRCATVGGLYVLGTERHESRRIDNQLRGRSGRQGDPGESRFYLSLEDELMRLFATGLMQRVMDKSFEDDMPLESKMVSKAVERAQGTVEDRNFEIRKDVLKYDEVMNEQRKIIYRRRQQILDGEDLRDAAIDAIESTIGRLVDQYCGERVRGGVEHRGAARRHAHALPDARHQGAARRRGRHRRRWRSCSSTTRPRCTPRRKSRSAPRPSATSNAG